MCYLPASIIFQLSPQANLISSSPLGFDHSYIGVDGRIRISARRMATPARPLVLTDPYNSEGSWTQWEYHFLNVAAVNKWDDANKLKWLKVRLTVRAQTSFQRLPDATKTSFDDSTKALRERFEPATRKTRYQAEMQTRRKKKAESWVDLADDLRLIADKDYPDLEANDRAWLALWSHIWDR